MSLASNAVAMGMVKKTELAMSVPFTKMFDEVFFQVKQCNMTWAERLEWE